MLQLIKSTGVVCQYAVCCFMVVVGVEVSVEIYSWSVSKIH